MAWRVVVTVFKLTATAFRETRVAYAAKYRPHRDLTRETMVAYVALGGNEGPGWEPLRAALDMMHRHYAVRAIGGLYETRPWGPVPQSNFYNTVVSITGWDSPHDLLAYAKHMEQALGRIRDGVRWGPRRIDVDIISCGMVCMSDPVLTLPHPRWSARDFVIRPIMDTYPYSTMPGYSAARLGKLLERAPPTIVKRCAWC